jgi:XTP/dITP diphosphohydrolase
MTMKLPQDKIVVASHNPGKVREIADLLRPLGIDTVSADELDLPEPEETETTFEGNARLKAEAAAAASGLAALSDDSGLCVDALGGAPGIFSARWAGPSKDFRIAMQKVEHELRDRYALSPDQRNAHFVCALCLAIPGQEPRVYRGEVHGVMVWPPCGERGFGYDPVFQPEGHQITFGEMDPDAKHAMSHRARAFAQLVGELKAAIG